MKYNVREISILFDFSFTITIIYSILIITFYLVYI
jgi:hypothetical protein